MPFNDNFSSGWEDTNIWETPGSRDTSTEEEDSVENSLVLAADIVNSNIHSDHLVSSPPPRLLGPMTPQREGRLISPPPMDMTPTAPTGFTSPRRRQYMETNDSNEESSSMPSQKRVAISGPSQHVLDDLRAREEISRYRAVEHAVRIKNLNEEIRRLQQDRINAMRQLENNQEVENQMTDQILQFEKEVEMLGNQNAHLTETLKRNEIQVRQLQESNEAIEQRVREMADIHAREKERQENEILSLRHSLQSNETTLPNSNSRLRRHPTVFRRGNPTNIGVVPLRPVATAAVSPEDDCIGAENDINTPQGHSNVAAIVKEVLQQLNVTSVTVHNGQRSRKRQSARSRNQQAITEQKTKMTKDKDLDWKSAVRNAWKCYYNITSFSDFGEYVPASPDMVEAFETGHGGPDESNLLDFGKRYEKSRWNKVILTRLCQRILDEREADETWRLPDVSHTYLIALISSQLKRSREAWRLVQARPNFSEQRLESVAEIVGRIEDYTTTRLATIGSRSRHERKYQRRMNAVNKVISLKSGAPDLATWKYFRNLLEKLSIDGMSSEDDAVTKIGNVNVPVFHVKLCPWRHPVIRNYFTYIDQESQNPAIRSHKGSKLHPRIPTDITSDSPPPKGLPRSLYDEAWLQKEEETRGSQYIEEELTVSREVFELLVFAAT